MRNIDHGAIHQLSGNYFICPKITHIKKFGIIPASILFLLYKEFENRDDWNIYRFKDLSDKLNISDHKVRQAIRILKEAGMIKVMRKGMPCLTYYQLVIENYYL